MWEGYILSIRSKIMETLLWTPKATLKITYYKVVNHLSMFLKSEFNQHMWLNYVLYSDCFSMLSIILCYILGKHSTVAKLYFFPCMSWVFLVEILNNRLRAVRGFVFFIQYNYRTIVMLLWPRNLKVLTLSSGKFCGNRAFNKDTYDFFYAYHFGYIRLFGEDIGNVTQRREKSFSNVLNSFIICASNMLNSADMAQWLSKSILYFCDLLSKDNICTRKQCSERKK